MATRRTGDLITPLPGVPPPIRTPLFQIPSMPKLIHYAMFESEVVLEGPVTIYQAKAGVTTAIQHLAIRPCPGFDLGLDYGQLVLDYAETGVETYRAPIVLLMYELANPAASIHDLLAAASARARLEARVARVTGSKEEEEELNQLQVDLDSLMLRGFKNRVERMRHMNVPAVLKSGECMDLRWIPGADPVEPGGLKVILGGMTGRDVE